MASLAGLLLLALPALPAKTRHLSPEVQGFVNEMVEKHRFDPLELSALMFRARHRQSIIDAITRPAEARPWYQYRPIFVTDDRARAGLEFWNANEELLRQVEERYGVPAEIIVAIIGVETRYGRHTGKYRVLDSLYTLAFGYPKRSDFFRRELEQFLLLAREERLDPAAASGSYAGAMGTPQFIASSYRRYAVDFDGDGIRDLWRSEADVVGSVANYFARHGWQRGLPIATPASGVDDSHRRFVDAGMKPSLKVSVLRSAGISGGESLDPEALASLIQLDNGSGKEYWLGLHNFYVITRYNHSSLYAMAVYQLSRKILLLRKAR